MKVSELEKIMDKVCGEAVGAGSRLAEMIGTSPATVSRWRDGKVPISARDAKLLRLICHLKGKLDWVKLSEKPVTDELYEIL